MEEAVDLARAWDDVHFLPDLNDMIWDADLTPAAGSDSAPGARRFEDHRQQDDEFDIILIEEDAAFWEALFRVDMPGSDGELSPRFSVDGTADMDSKEAWATPWAEVADLVAFLEDAVDTVEAGAAAAGTYAGAVEPEPLDLELRL